MNKLRKFLCVCLICSVFFFTLIPKTYADTSVTIGMSGEIRTITDVFVSSFVNDSYISVKTGEFPTFVGLSIPMNFSKSCDYLYVYRIDYTIWGWHNPDKTAEDWRKYAKLIDYNGTEYELEVLGTVIQYSNQYEINFSTFIEWSPTYCPVDTLNTLELSISDVPGNLYFWNSNHNDNHDYTTLNSIFGQVDKSLAVDLINDYYNGNPVNDKLDDLKGEILYTNEKLDDIKEELKSVSGNIEKTNEKLNELKDSISNQSNVIDKGFENMNETQKDTNEKLDNVNSSIKDTQDYLKDDTAPSADINVLGNVQGILPEGPIDSLLNIPFKVLSILSSSFGGVCVPISGKFVFDSTLTIPCFSELFYNNVPDSIMVFINVVPTAFILIAYLKNLYKRVDRALSLETSADDEWGGI